MIYFTNSEVKEIIGQGQTKPLISAMFLSDQIIDAFRAKHFDTISNFIPTFK